MSTFLNDIAIRAGLKQTQTTPPQSNNAGSINGRKIAQHLCLMTSLFLSAYSAYETFQSYSLNNTIKKTCDIYERTSLSNECQELLDQKENHFRLANVATDVAYVFALVAILVFVTKKPNEQASQPQLNNPPPVFDDFV